MRTHALFIFTSLLLQLSATAARDPRQGFTGRWIGKGQMIQKQAFGGTTKTDCDLIDVTLSQVKDSFVITHYHGHCGTVDSEWGPHKFKIHEGKVYEDKEDSQDEPESVGTFDGVIFKTTIPGGSVRYAKNFRLVAPDSPDKTTTLQTYYGVQNMVGAIVIEGYLKPADVNVE